MDKEVAKGLLAHLGGLGAEHFFLVVGYALMLGSKEEMIAFLKAEGHEKHIDQHVKVWDVAEGIDFTQDYVFGSPNALHEYWSSYEGMRMFMGMPDVDIPSNYDHTAISNLVARSSLPADGVYYLPPTRKRSSRAASPVSSADGETEISDSKDDPPYSNTTTSTASDDDSMEEVVEDLAIQPSEPPTPPAPNENLSWDIVSTFPSVESPDNIVMSSEFRLKIIRIRPENERGYNYKIPTMVDPLRLPESLPLFDIYVTDLLSGEFTDGKDADSFPALTIDPFVLGDICLRACRKYDPDTFPVSPPLSAHGKLFLLCLGPLSHFFWQDNIFTSMMRRVLLKA